jgi:nucleoside-diphosphate kinase
MIKPDGVRKNLVGEVISRFEKRGLKVQALKMISLSRDQAERLYEVHREKPFYEELVNFVLSGPVVTMILNGNDAVRAVREVMGATNPREAAPGTIRGDFAEIITENIVHGADSEENAKREMAIFFGGGKQESSSGGQ